MKFYYLKSKLVALLLFVASQQIMAQEASFSPYSRFGIGELRSNGSASQIFGANAGIGELNLLTPNLLNPASFSKLTRPVFDANFVYTNTQLKNNTSTQSINTGTLGSINLVFPFNNGFAAAFRLNPFSTVAYKSTNTITVDTVTASDIYSGSGGITKAQLDISYNFLHKQGDSTYLGIAVSPEYYFGNIIQDRQLELNTAYSQNSANTRKTGVSDLAFSYALIFGKYLNEKHHISVGATFAPSVKLSRTYTELTQNYVSGSFDNINLKDTIFYLENDEGVLALPNRYSLGVSYRYNEKITINLAYRAGEWSKLYQTVEGNEEYFGTSNLSSFSVGLGFAPNNRESFNESIFRQARYNLGYSQNKGYINVNNIDLIEHKLSAGISLPLRKSNSGSFLHLGTVFGTRGDVTLLEENYIKVYFGISIRPKYIDKWFQKRKYN